MNVLAADDARAAQLLEKVARDEDVDRLEAARHARLWQDLLQVLRLLVRDYKGRKIFMIIDNVPCHRLDRFSGTVTGASGGLIIDNAPCHRLDEDGVRWLRQNRHLIQRVPTAPALIAAHVARFR